MFPSGVFSIRNINLRGLKGNGNVARDYLICLIYHYNMSLYHFFSAFPGYIIYYSTDVNAEVHDWVIEPVVGNRLTHQIQELTLDTSYYFKIQARNSKGMGPMSDAVQFRTPKGKPAHSRWWMITITAACWKDQHILGYNSKNAMGYWCNHYVS